MLKVTVVNTASEQKLVLEGRLAAPDLSELESAWQDARSARGSRRCVVDLRNATFIDRRAETILLDMKREGAQFFVCGVCTRHHLEQLGIKCE
jgi:anti-anti-sigma regulatory factor